MSFSIDKPKLRLELLPGGRDGADPSGEEWRAFCARIGWQENADPALADDYEDELARRIFGPGDNLVSLDAERERRRVEQAVWDGEAAREQAPRVSRGASWQVLVAVAALVVLVGAALLAWRGSTETTRITPAPAPEVTQRATVAPAPGPPPIDSAQRRAAPDPGAARARTARALARPVVVIAQAAPAAIEPGAPAIDPDGDAAEAREVPLAIASVPLLPAAEPSDAPVASYSPSARRPDLPSWLDVAMTAPREHDGLPAGVRVMAQLDLADAGRRLAEQL